MADIAFIESMNDTYFHGELSESQINFLKDLDMDNAEAVGFVEGAMARMKRILISARDCTEFIFWEMASIWPKILPGAWSGIVPPITFSNRHVLLENYMEKNRWKPLNTGSQVLDIGCGFPPLTAVDLSKRFSEVNVIGADVSFGKYTVTDSDGNYACISNEGDIKYLQPVSGRVDQWNRLFENLEATRLEFLRQFIELKDGLPEQEKQSGYEEFQRDGWSIVRNPLRKYGSGNLSFVEKGIGDDGFPNNLDLIRCMNVLLYFDPAFREHTLEWACRHLKAGGLFVCGMNWSESINCRFSVYRKEGDTMILKEFSFSVENIRPLEGVSYFSFRDDDFEQEQMLEHILLIRQHGSFMEKFNSGFDELLKQNAVCTRNETGYLGFINATIAPHQLLANMSNTCFQLSGLFAEEAVALLRGLGREAWVNEIGFISVLIPDQGLRTSALNR